MVVQVFVKPRATENVHWEKSIHICQLAWNERESQWEDWWVVTCPVFHSCEVTASLEGEDGPINILMIAPLPCKSLQWDLPGGCRWEEPHCQKKGANLKTKKGAQNTAKATASVSSWRLPYAFTLSCIHSFMHSFIKSEHLLSFHSEPGIALGMCTQDPVPAHRFTGQ